MRTIFGRSPLGWRWTMGLRKKKEPGVALSYKKEQSDDAGVEEHQLGAALPDHFALQLDAFSAKSAITK